LRAAIVDFREHCASEGLKEDLKPWVDKLESLCVTGTHIIDACQSIDNSDAAWQSYSEASTEMAGWPQIGVPQLSGGQVAAEIGSVKLTPFIKTTMGKLENLLSGKLSGDKLTKTNEMITNVPGITPKPVTKSGNTFSVSGLTDVTLTPYQYVGLKLDNVYQFDTVAFSFENTEGFVFDGSLGNQPVLQASADGISWTSMDYTKTGNETASVFTCIAGESIGAARYFRVLAYDYTNVNDGIFKFDLTNMQVTVTGGVDMKPVSAASTAGIYNQNTPDRLFDGNYTTSYWTNSGQVPGQEVVAEFAETFELQDFALYEANGDYIRVGAMYVSEDRENWTQISTIGTNFTPETVNGTEYYVIRGNGNGVKMKYLKIATEGTANVWTKVHEFEFNQTTGAKNGTIPAFSSVLDGVPTNLIDSNYNSLFTTTSAEPYLDYRFSENANATSLVVLQNSENLSNAKVLIRTPEEGSSDWQEIGTLAAAYNEFDLSVYPFGITDLRLAWADNGIVPLLHEIYTKTEIDKTALIDCIAAAKEIELPSGMENVNSYLQFNIRFAEGIVADPLAPIALVTQAHENLKQCMNGIGSKVTIYDIVRQGDSITVQVQNWEDMPKDATVILAVYDNQGALDHVDSISETLEGASSLPSTTTFTFSSAADGQLRTYKVFVWDANDFTPFTPSEEFSY
ncbi:MAG: discoidin domain-containing protein, partial [Clostridiales bacterium]|nr:discoidin domain-containing protein [Clostridiales bacterium]